MVRRNNDFMKLPDEERLAYERYQEDLHYQASMFHSSYYCGIKKGEKQKVFQIAASLLDVLDAETIAAKTGLTVEEIQGLRREQNK